MKNITNVLCVSDYFYPGYIGGGSITTLLNMRQQLKGHVKFSVFTRDRDLGATMSYNSIDVDRWLDTTDGLIYYASPGNFGTSGILSAIETIKPDIVYLNSFFSPNGSVFPLMSLRRGENRPRVLIAPRGEFSAGALELKKLKKHLFIMFSRFIGLHSDVFWHASTDLEADDICRIFRCPADRIFVAADPVLIDSSCYELSGSKKKAGELRIVFLSRISPIKNLAGLLKILSTVRFPVYLDIFGPLEDKIYWAYCVALIESLPSNVKVTVKGPVCPQAVSRVIADYDLFAFPTFGENFGHVIFEALRVGTPVLVSDRTPWQPDNDGGLTVIPLNDTKGWCDAITKAAMCSDEVHEMSRYAARRYAILYSKRANTLQANLDLFLNVLRY